MHPEIPREFGVEGKSPDGTGAHADHLIPRQAIARRRTDRQDPRGPDEDPREGPPAHALHAHRSLERFALGAVIVPADPDVSTPNVGGSRPAGLGVEVAGEQDQSRAGRQDRKPVRQPRARGAPRGRSPGAGGDRGRLSAGEEKRVDLREVAGRWTATT